jgi:hypothetical protein
MPMKTWLRLNKFFEFINLNGTMQEKCSAFVKNANEQPSWALGSVIKFLQMNKALMRDNKRNVAFALVVLQRRLASSTYAILKSLERRKKRLEDLITGAQKTGSVYGPGVILTSIV